jgi:hypothetical protein
MCNVGAKEIEVLKEINAIKKKPMPGVVAHPCNLTWEAEMGRITVRGQTEQKAHEMSSKSIKAGRGGTCLSSQLHRKSK